MNLFQSWTHGSIQGLYETIDTCMLSLQCLLRVFSSFRRYIFFCHRGFSLSSTCDFYIFPWYHQSNCLVTIPNDWRFWLYIYVHNLSCIILFPCIQRLAFWQTLFILFFITRSYLYIYICKYLSSKYLFFIIFSGGQWHCCFICIYIYNACFLVFIHSWACMHKASFVDICSKTDGFFYSPTINLNWSPLLCSLICAKLQMEWWTSLR